VPAPPTNRLKTASRAFAVRAVGSSIGVLCRPLRRGLSRGGVIDQLSQTTRRSPRSVLARAIISRSLPVFLCQPVRLRRSANVWVKSAHLLVQRRGQDFIAPTPIHVATAGGRAEEALGREPDSVSLNSARPGQAPGRSTTATTSGATTGEKSVVTHVLACTGAVHEPSNARNYTLGARLHEGGQPHSRWKHTASRLRPPPRVSARSSNTR